jgi:hypothetical protein
MREVLFGRSIVLLAGGLLIGWIAGPDSLIAQGEWFFDLFKGILALFMLDMGMVAASRVRELPRTGPFLIAFGTVMPPVFALIGAALGTMTRLSAGGTMLLAALAASASYIAAPPAMCIAPQANPSHSLAASLGVAFAFHIVVGIQIWVFVKTCGSILGLDSLKPAPALGLQALGRAANLA